MSTEKIFYTTVEAAHLLSVSTRTIYNLFSAGSLKGRRIGRRRLVSRAELEAFARRDQKTRKAN